MRVLTKTLPAVALAISLTVAGASQALVYAQFSPDTSAQTYSWVNSGPGDAGAGGTLSTIGTQAVHFSFIDPSMDPGLMFIPAAFTFSATAPLGSPATFIAGPNVWAQAPLSGDFSFTYTGPTQLFGSTLVTTGSNLLSGTFSNAWIQGAGGSGSTNLSVSNGGFFTTLTSDYEDFSTRIPGSEEFAFNLLGATPQFGAEAGAALRSFTANGGGNFSFDSLVPEPATWAMMIMGFGGIGTLLRRRRQGTAFA